MYTHHRNWVGQHTDAESLVGHAGFGRQPPAYGGRRLDGTRSIAWRSGYPPVVPMEAVFIELRLSTVCVDACQLFEAIVVRHEGVLLQLVRRRVEVRGIPRIRPADRVVDEPLAAPRGARPDRDRIDGIGDGKVVRMVASLSVSVEIWGTDLGCGVVRGVCGENRI